MHTTARLSHFLIPALDRPRSCFQLADSRGCYPNILVGAPIIEKPSLSVAHHPLNKDNVGHLANLFPLMHWFEDWLLGASDYLGWVPLVKKHPASSINTVIVRSVVNQENATLGDDGCGAGLYHLRVEHLWAARQYRMVEYIRPVNEIIGLGNRHLRRLLCTVCEVIHPVLAIYFFRDDRSGFSPAYIPFAPVVWHDNALAFPMNEVSRCSHT